MQKLDQIQKYAVLEEGTDATFVHPITQADQARKIRMRINAPQAVNLFITPVEYDYETETVTQHNADGQIFLAHIAAGFDSLDFMYQGSFCLNAIGGDIWLDTYDNSTFNVEASDPTSFARLFEREERHPAILEMERMQRHNLERMRRENQLDMEAAVAAMEKRLAANVAPTASTTPVGTNGGTSDARGPVSSGAAPIDTQPDTAVKSAPDGEPS